MPHFKKTNENNGSSFETPVRFELVWKTLLAWIFNKNLVMHNIQVQLKDHE